jgi:hypothetical protein|tara:strand:- start:189 stop:374 length:186 start_codon:yes stop_codon:yes gene_type:complete
VINKIQIIKRAQDKETIPRDGFNVWFSLYFFDFFITGYWGPKEYKMSKNAFKDLGPQTCDQ